MNAFTFVPPGGSLIATVGWSLWVAFFAVWEAWGLLYDRHGGGPGKTLSGQFWNVLKVNDPRPTWFTWVLRALFVAGWVWVGPHLLLGWWS